jgi:hypothetical protein
MAAAWEKFRKTVLEPAAGKKISSGVGGVASTVSKGAGDIYSLAVKQPTVATYQSVKQGSINPLKKYGQKLISPVTKPLKNTLQTDIIKPIQNITDNTTNTMRNQDTGNRLPGLVDPYQSFTQKLNLTSEASAAENPNLVALIGDNESSDFMRSQIGQQYRDMSELAKLREGGQRRTEQSAMARRLAASGMGGSGAGMRMAQQSEQEAGRRAAESQLGLSSEQARAMQSADQATQARNIQRAGMRLGAAESEAKRVFEQRQYKDQQEQMAKEFERQNQEYNETQKRLDRAEIREDAVIEANQKIAKDIQKYNESGFFGQILGDLFGGDGYSMKYPLGKR